MDSKRIRLWDLPTRVFHWALALCVLAAVISGQWGGKLIDWHGRIGLAIVGLIVFRLAWGLLGSTYARFGQFFPTPGRIRAYLRGEWSGEGHNPLGAVSVFVLLGLLTAQLLTGLVANDDIAFVGPLHDLVGSAWSNRLTGVHHLLSNLLIGLVVLHVGAIGYYGHVRKQKLLKPMLTGWKEATEGESATGGGVVALFVALAIAGLAVYGASGLWLPVAEPVPAAAAPNW